MQISICVYDGRATAKKMLNRGTSPEMLQIQKMFAEDNWMSDIPELKLPSLVRGVFEHILELTI